MVRFPITGGAPFFGSGDLLKAAGYTTGLILAGWPPRVPDPAPRAGACRLGGGQGQGATIPALPYFSHA